MRIPTFIINLKRRVDRRVNVLKQFEGRHEFDLIVVEAIRHEIGAIGLWKTIKHILRDLTTESDEYILIVEDDHEFTKSYSKDVLFEHIANARRHEADILCGGVSWASNIVSVRYNMFWVEKFSGLQFTVVFKKFFDKILSADFKDYDAADYKISELSNSIFFIFPFISQQKDFGYSDVTHQNNFEGKVDELFKNSNEIVNVAIKVENFYSNIYKRHDIFDFASFSDVVVPTYIINLPERVERRSHIKKQFEKRNEFDVKIIEACRHQVGALGLWMSIRKIIQMAIQEDDDVIIICEDDHEFTEDYTKEYLIRNIVEAQFQGIDMLLGGVIEMRTALPIADNRFWISSFWSTQFVVLYKKVFQRIIDEPFDETITADGRLSEMIANKAVLFPFVSIQREFGYSDATPAQNNFRMNKTNEMKFQECIGRFQRIRDAHLKYKSTMSQKMWHNIA